MQAYKLYFESGRKKKKTMVHVLVDTIFTLTEGNSFYAIMMELEALVC